MNTKLVRPISLKIFAMFFFCSVALSAFQNCGPFKPSAFKSDVLGSNSPDPVLPPGGGNNSGNPFPMRSSTSVQYLSITAAASPATGANVVTTGAPVSPVDRDLLSRSHAAYIVLSAFDYSTYGARTDADKNIFTDIDTDYYKSYIIALGDLQITSGCAIDGTKRKYCPNADLPLWQFLTFAMRASQTLGKLNYNYQEALTRATTNLKPDVRAVPSAAQLSGYWLLAFENNIINESDLSFDGLVRVVSKTKSEQIMASVKSLIAAKAGQQPAPTPTQAAGLHPSNCTLLVNGSPEDATYSVGDQITWDIKRDGTLIADFSKIELKWFGTARDAQSKIVSDLNGETRSIGDFNGPILENAAGNTYFRYVQVLDKASGYVFCVTQQGSSKGAITISVKPKVLPPAPTCSGIGITTPSNGSCGAGYILDSQSGCCNERNSGSKYCKNSGEPRYFDQYINTDPQHYEKYYGAWFNSEGSKLPCRPIERKLCTPAGLTTKIFFDGACPTRAVIDTSMQHVAETFCLGNSFSGGIIIEAEPFQIQTNSSGNQICAGTFSYRCNVCD